MNNEIFSLENNMIITGFEGRVLIKDSFGDYVSIPQALLDEYAEEYIKANFKLIANDGWVRKDKKNGE